MVGPTGFRFKNIISYEKNFFEHYERHIHDDFLYGPPCWEWACLMSQVGGQSQWEYGYGIIDTFPVLLDAPYIPAGMAKFHWNPQE